MAKKNVNILTFIIKIFNNMLLDTRIHDSVRIDYCNKLKSAWGEVNNDYSESGR